MKTVGSTVVNIMADEDTAEAEGRGQEDSTGTRLYQRPVCWLYTRPVSGSKLSPDADEASTDVAPAAQSSSAEGTSSFPPERRRNAEGDERRVEALPGGKSSSEAPGGG